MLKLLRFLKLSYHFVRIVGNTERLPDVVGLSRTLIKLSDMSGQAAILQRLESSATWRAARQARTRLGAVDLDALRKLPAATLGGAYARFLDERGLRPESLPTFPDGANDFEYLLAHMYEAHDLWHVVTGFDTDARSEVGLQAFYLTQYSSPLSALLTAAGLLNAFFRDPQRIPLIISAVARGWTLGQNAAPLVGRDWKRDLERPLAEVRAELGIAPPPPAPPQASLGALSPLGA